MFKPDQNRLKSLQTIKKLSKTIRTHRKTYGESRGYHDNCCLPRQRAASTFKLVCQKVFPWYLGCVLENQCTWTLQQVDLKSFLEDYMYCKITTDIPISHFHLKVIWPVRLIFQSVLSCPIRPNPADCNNPIVTYVYCRINRFCNKGFGPSPLVRRFDFWTHEVVHKRKNENVARGNSELISDWVWV